MLLIIQDLLVTSIYLSVDPESERTPIYYTMKSNNKKTSHVTTLYYDKDVTRTELSADPVKKMGRVGCQSTAVIGAPCGSVLQPFT